MRARPPRSESDSASSAIPAGLSSDGAPGKGPGTNATLSTTNATETAASHSTGRQRAEGSLPSGKSNSSGATRTQLVSKIEPAQATQVAPGGKLPGGASTGDVAYTPDASDTADSNAAVAMTQPMTLPGWRAIISAPMTEAAPRLPANITRRTRSSHVG